MPRVSKRSPCSTPVLRYARNRCATFPKIAVVSHSSRSQRSTRLPSLSNSSRGVMNSEIENTSVFGPQVLTMMPCGMNRSWIRWRLTVAPGRSIFPLLDDRDRTYFGRGSKEEDQIGFLDESTRAIFGRSYAAEPGILIEQLKKD